MTNKQQGWNDALNIVIEQFHDVAWQNELARLREKAAEDMGKQVRYKLREWSTVSWQVMGDVVRVQVYRQAMNDVVTPFCEMLKGEPQRKLPFNS